MSDAEKSLNESEEEEKDDEGGAVEGEKLSKQGAMVRPGSIGAPGGSSRPGVGGGMPRPAVGTFKSISDAKDGLSKAEDPTAVSRGGIPGVMAGGAVAGEPTSKVIAREKAAKKASISARAERALKKHEDISKENIFEHIAGGAKVLGRDVVSFGRGVKEVAGQVLREGIAGEETGGKGWEEARARFKRSLSSISDAKDGLSKAEPTNGSVGKIKAGSSRTANVPLIEEETSEQRAKGPKPKTYVPLARTGQAGIAKVGGRWSNLTTPEGQDAYAASRGVSKEELTPTVRSVMSEGTDYTKGPQRNRPGSRLPRKGEVFQGAGDVVASGTTPKPSPPPQDPRDAALAAHKKARAAQKHAGEVKELDEILARKEEPKFKFKTFKSIESTHGSQMKKSFHVGGSCGICNRVSKSITDNVCDDCKSSMGTTQWHTSHLA